MSSPEDLFLRNVQFGRQQKNGRGRVGARRSSPWLPQTIAAVAVVAGAGCVMAAAKGAVRHGSTSERQTAAPAVAAVPVATSDQNSLPPLDYYTRALRSNLFSPPAPPQPRIEVHPLPAPVLQIVPVNPFADWSYTGTMHVGSETTALIENEKTHDGQFVKVGDSFLGAKVKGVTDEMVTLVQDGKPTLLARSDNMVVTPLDKSATEPAAPAQTQAQSAPGQPGLLQMPPMKMNGAFSFQGLGRGGPGSPQWQARQQMRAMRGMFNRARRMAGG